MRIFGPLLWPTISPVTVTEARAAASLVTVSPSTSRIAGRVTVSPASPVRRFTVNRSPTATLCWLPPAFTTAYTTDSSFLATLVRPARTPWDVHRGWAGSARPTVAGGVQPDQRTRSGRGPCRAAGPPASARPRDRGHLRLVVVHRRGARGLVGHSLQHSLDVDRLVGRSLDGDRLVGDGHRLDGGERPLAGRRPPRGRGGGARPRPRPLLPPPREDGGG